MLRLEQAGKVRNYEKVYLKNAFSKRGARHLYTLNRTITGLWAFRPGKKVRLQPNEYVYILEKIKKK